LGETRPSIRSGEAGFLPVSSDRMRSHRLELTYQAGWFSLGEAVARLAPRGVLRAFGAAWGWIFARSHPRNVAVVRRNLALLGETSDADARAVYSEFGRVLADYFHAGPRGVQAAIDLVDERLGFEHLKAAHEAGKGALLLTAHLSFFELGSAVMHEFGYPMVALTNPEPSPALTAWRAAYRARWGVETVEVGPEQWQFVEIVKHLKAGKFVAALFDRPHATQSFAAELPGGRLPCSSGILLLALLAGCPVIPVTVVAKPNRRYRLEALPPITIERRGTPAEMLQHYTQVLVDALRPIITAHPRQWFQFAPLDVPPAASD
jgi:lauroyl/myristoyl acyltransferase